ncbi:alpha/beta hydrolase [Enterovibrio calviensis]|uniref:alpha/beta hydrolase n=1 Tax=Enterovibrio calviensis TaxID=91359 RepID=UPI001B80AF96|nr:alpha/beta hydrolase [Enterovibrio calviensis]
MIFVPGGGFVNQPELCSLSNNAAGLPEMLAADGWDFAQVCYELAPENKYPVQHRYTKEQIKSLAVGYSKVAVIGSSAGANIATLATLEIPGTVDYLIGFYGIYDIPSLPVDVQEAYSDLYTDDPYAASPTSYPLPNHPVKLFHAVDDSLIPFEQSVLYCDSCTTLYQTGGHSYPMIRSYDEIIALIDG